MAVGSHDARTVASSAETKNKTIMGLMHKYYNIHGFQFHPESIGTEVGKSLLSNFLNLILKNRNSLNVGTQLLKR